MPYKFCAHINETSNFFTLSRGTRQGCPLSPLLFGLAIEPSAIAIRQTNTFRGFRRGEREDKLSLYGDDALLFLGYTDYSLMTLIKMFGSFSGFNINWDRSVLNPVDEISPILPQMANKIKIATSFKYLG